jgi:hypothetical protein
MLRRPPWKPPRTNRKPNRTCWRNEAACKVLGIYEDHKTALVLDFTRYPGIIKTILASGSYYQSYPTHGQWTNDLTHIEERLPHNVKREGKIPSLLLLCSEGASTMGGWLVPIDADEGRAYNL